jgi:hypothetical protein
MEIICVSLNLRLLIDTTEQIGLNGNVSDLYSELADSPTLAGYIMDSHRELS